MMPGPPPVITAKPASTSRRPSPPPPVVPVVGRRARAAEDADGRADPRQRVEALHELAHDAEHAPRVRCVAPARCATCRRGQQPLVLRLLPGRLLELGDRHRRLRRRRRWRVSFLPVCLSSSSPPPAAQHRRAAVPRKAALPALRPAARPILPHEMPELRYRVEAAISARRAAPALRVSSCAECGAKLVPGARFCNSCGAPVGAAAPPVGASPAAPARPAAAADAATCRGTSPAPCSSSHPRAGLPIHDGWRRRCRPRGAGALHGAPARRRAAAPRRARPASRRTGCSTGSWPPASRATCDGAAVRAHGDPGLRGARAPR
jgi:hypothetical protein